MSQLIDKILDLQKHHAHWHGLKEKARRVSLAVAAGEKQVALVRAELARLDEDRKASQRAADAKELEVKSLQAKIARMREQLNAIKDNRQYQALMNEIRFAEIERRRFEDDELERLEQVDDDKRKIAEGRERLARAEQELSRLKAEKAAETEALDGDIRQAECERADIIRDLPRDVVALFDRVTAKHADGAMCRLVKDDENGGPAEYSCGGCHMRLTENVYVKLLGNRDEIITCPTCSRILYVEL